ncbi:ecdysteroid kinase domain-containing protein [Phthorimaea operculella]|nr:ecdysteroid kinase domain-containing protein [Phthorimaea operculella]
MEVEKHCCKDDDSKRIPEIVLEKAESIAKKEGFVSYSVKGKRLTPDGGNYLAVLYEVDIKEETNKCSKEVNLFIKVIIPENEFLDDFFSTQKAYLNESFVYKELSKVFQTLEQQAGVPNDERYKMVKTFDETTSEVIIMENLNKKGFKTCDRIEVAPLKFVELSVQQLAKFHGLGFAMKTKLPNYYEKYVAAMKTTDMVNFNENWRKFFRATTEQSVKNLRPDFKKRIEAFLPKAMIRYQKYYTEPTPIQTMCHGDFRANNILIKQSEGEIVEIIPVDMQIVNHGCPANDFIYFIYGCTDRQFRDKHLGDILDLYFDTLKSYLKYFDIDVADVCPRSKFNTILKEKADFGFIIAIHLYPFFFASEDDQPDMSDNDNPIKEMNFPPQIVHRIEELVEEAIDAGIL